MPTRRLDPPEDSALWKLQRRAACFDPDHNPPSMMVYENGTYEHTCPSCGKVQIFTVARGTYL